MQLPKGDNLLLKEFELSTNIVDEVKYEKFTRRPISIDLISKSNTSLTAIRTTTLLSPLVISACGGGGGADTVINSPDKATGMNALYQTPSWQVTEMAEGYWYAGQYYPSMIVFHHPKNIVPIDIDNDGDLDVIVPFVVGYRTGVDSRQNFMVLENINGTLITSEEMTAASPFVAGAGRTGEIYLQAYQASAFVTVNIGSATETEQDNTLPWRFGDLTITLLDPYVGIEEVLIGDIQLPLSTIAQRATAVNAHALAIGDINSDGLDDILVGELSGPFALLQTSGSSFEIFNSELLASLSNWIEPELDVTTPSFLLDLHMNDFNGDGLDDIVVGWGHNPSLSRIFFNSANGFSSENSVVLPEPIYGSGNVMHINTFSGDFANDGRQDIIVVQTRFEPWYGGTYLQYLRNDGAGNFFDETNERLVSPTEFRDTFGDRLEGNFDSFSIIDFDFDGDLDIVGAYSGREVNTLEPIVFINDGTGHFTLFELPIVDAFGGYGIWADFNQNGVMELLTYNSSWDDASGTSSTNFFQVFEFNDSLSEILNSSA